MPMHAVTARAGLGVVAAAFLTLAAIAAIGCASVPPGRSAVDVVDLVGAHDVSAGDVTDKLATAASPKFLGLFRGVVYDYSVFDAAALQRDLARVERYYRGRGFFEAHARTGHVVPTAANHVRVEIVVEEGVPSVNRRIDVSGLDDLAPAMADEVRAAVASALPPGARFDEDTYRGVVTTVTRALTDRGFAYAKVDVKAEADLPAHAVDYAFSVQAGPAAKFGAVTIVSVAPDGSTGALVDIEEAPVRRAIHLREGSAYSTAKIESATQALLDLKVFTSVEIVPQLPDPPAPVVPLIVKIAPTKLRSLRAGVGVELDELKTDVHGLLGWEDLNFLGGLRDMNVELKPGAVLYPIRISSNGFVGLDQIKLLPEEHLRAQLRQNGFLEARTSLFVRPEINAYPLLVETTYDPNASVVGYLEPRGAVGLDRRFGKHFFASLSHNVQTEIPVPYKGTFDPNLPNVVLSYPQLVTTLDFRDDPVHPHAGIYLSDDFQFAGLGGSAHDFRVAPEVRAYVPLAKGITLAVREAVGFLFPLDYGGYIQSGQLTTNTQTDTAGINNDIEIVYFRGLFSGGPGSNRGFPLRGIAPHGIVPFLNPGTATVQGALGCGTAKTIDPACAIPIGGFSQWESSVEVRFDVTGPLGAAVFCDAADVSAQETDLRFDHPHLSCGGGVRYATPVGPLRLDVGYRIQPLQVLGKSDEDAAAAADPREGIQPKIFHQPLAIAFGLGEAF